MGEERERERERERISWDQSGAADDLSLANEEHSENTNRKSQIALVSPRCVPRVQLHRHAIFGETHSAVTLIDFLTMAPSRIESFSISFASQSRAGRIRRRIQRYIFGTFPKMAQL
jgi:hypothetical protein